MGCKRLKTGVNGRGWVRMDALGRRRHGEHKNKASRGHSGSRRPESWAHGRGNFPGHHVLSKTKKKYMNDPGWVHMGVLWVLWGVGARGDRKTSGEKAQMGRTGRVLHAWSRQ